MLITFPYYLKNRIKIDAQAKLDPEMEKSKREMLLAAKKDLAEMIALIKAGKGVECFVDLNDIKNREAGIRWFNENRINLMAKLIGELAMVERELIPISVKA